MGLLKGDLLMGYKNFWILLIMLLTGIVLGGFIGQLADGVVWLKWLNYGQSFGHHQDHHGKHHWCSHCPDYLSHDLKLLLKTANISFIPENVLGEVRSQENKWKELQ